MTSPEHPPGADPTLGALVHDLTQQMSTLVREEIRLAQAELTQKGKQAGKGAGLFGVAGLLGFLGLCVVITTVILALALVLPAWLSALIVAVVLLLAAGLVALSGKKQVQQASPVKPERALEGVKEDVATVKGERSHEHAV